MQAPKDPPDGGGNQRWTYTPGESRSVEQAAREPDNGTIGNRPPGYWRAKLEGREPDPQAAAAGDSVTRKSFDDDEAFWRGMDEGLKPYTRADVQVGVDTHSDSRHYRLQHALGSEVVKVSGLKLLQCESLWNLGEDTGAELVRLAGIRKVQAAAHEVKAQAQQASNIERVYTDPSVADTPEQQEAIMSLSRARCEAAQEPSKEDMKPTSEPMITPDPAMLAAAYRKAQDCTVPSYDLLRAMVINMMREPIMREVLRDALRSDNAQEPVYTASEFERRDVVPEVECPRVLSWSPHGCTLGIRGREVGYVPEAKLAMAHKRLQEADGLLSLVLHELAGSVSLCWSPKPEGVFDSQQATFFVEQAIERLRKALRA